jgi:site-specific recombinase XerD
MTTAAKRPSPFATVVVSPSVLATAYVEGAKTAMARKQRLAVATAFTVCFGDPAGWRLVSLEERLAAPVTLRGFAALGVFTDRVAVDAEYVARAGTSWGHHARRVHPQTSTSFAATAHRIGFTSKEIQRQWATLAKLAAIAGVAPDHLHRHRFNAARDQLSAAIVGNHGGPAPITLTTPLHGLEATLAALDILDEPRAKAGTTNSRQAHWERLTTSAPALVLTMRRYLAQLGLSLRPGSVALIDTSLRHLADYLTEHHDQVTSAADIGRSHIEGFKAWLAARSGYRGHRAPAKTTIGMRISHLRGFFERIIEWEYLDAPARNPVFAGDMPIRDRPLPRFLDDADAAALLAAARALPELFDRVCVEVLARTGLRKGEFLGLTLDAVVQIGDSQWLRTPVGKLHTDRYIPLHPKVKELLEQWRTHRGEESKSSLMFIDRGRPVPQTRVDRAVHKAAAAAGLGHTTPHQMRHTLATQAINRGMSLEAIAALLGHRSMTMTMTYARIADKTVAEEYFAVSEKVEALYEPAPLPADAEGPNMRKLRTEANRRLLGNGYCSRPAELGCRYETICETCSFFAPTIAFRDTLQNQHDDAEAQGETNRQNVYLKILTDLDDPAS